MQHITRMIGGFSVHNLKSFGLAALGVALVAGSLSAQTATGQVAWRGVNGSSDCYTGGTISGCFYTSPYLAAFQIPSLPTNAQYLPPASTSGFGPTWDIFCVDFTHDANTNTTTGYAANFTNLGQDWSAIGTATRYGPTHTLQTYLESAWLSQQILAQGSFGSPAALDMNGAIWQIMSGFDVYRNGVNTNITFWADSAQKLWDPITMTEKGVNANNWVVVTDQLAAGPTNVSNGSQEFLTQVTPEPATLILFGTGLAVMFLGAGVVKRLTA